MLLFLGTGYGGLRQLTPKLISRGIVSEDGRREFGVELMDTWQLDDCSDFVKREVLPLLQGLTIPSSVARERLIRWFGDAPHSLQAACDSATDFHFLQYLFRLASTESKNDPLRSSPADRYNGLSPGGNGALRERQSRPSRVSGRASLSQRVACLDGRPQT